MDSERAFDILSLTRPSIKNNNMKDMKEHSPNKSNENKEDDLPENKNKLYPDLPDSDEEPDDDEQLSASSQSTPKSKQELVKNKKTSEDKIYNIWPIIVAIICVLLAYYALGQYYKDTTKPSTQDNVSVDQIVQSLEKKFPHQPKLSFRIIKASIKKILNVTNSDPTQPSVVLLASAKGAKKVVNNFATELAHLSSFSQVDYLSIDGSEFKNEGSSKAMKKIDEKIISECSSKIPAVVLIKNLDLVPAKAALIFTTYFDHENASFKRVVFILTIATVETIPMSADSKNFTSLAVNHLRQAWDLLSDDEFYALSSRMAVSVAAILPEDAP